MKLKPTVINCTLALALTVNSVQAAGFGSLFDSVKDQFDKQTKAKGMLPSQTNHPALKPNAPAAPSNIATEYYGESRDVNEYEGALTPDDRICAHIVDPFLLTDNASALLEDVATDAGKIMIENMLNGNNKGPGAVELLKSAKARGRKMNWMPMEQEVQYGQRLHEQRLKTDKNLFERSSKGRVKRLYATADEILNRVLSQLDEVHPYEFKLFLINNDEINAEALPGGYLYVNTGVLESGFAELVFAHEIAHVLKRHQTRETQARLIDTVETVEDLKALLNNSAPDASQITDRTASLHGQFLNYSRQQELQADACSVRLTHRIPGMDVDQQIEPYITSLSADVPSDTKQNVKFSGHPSFPERGKRMKEVAMAIRREQQSN